MGLTPQQTQDKTNADVARDGKWVTSNDPITNNHDSGMVLTYNGNKLVDKTGKPVYRPWDYFRDTTHYPSGVDTTNVKLPL